VLAAGGSTYLLLAQLAGTPGTSSEAQIVSVVFAVSSLAVALFAVLQARAAGHTTQTLASRSIAREEFDDVLAVSNELRAELGDCKKQAAETRLSLAECRKERSELERLVHRLRLMKPAPDEGSSGDGK
jgi:hypothetical protein